MRRRRPDVDLSLLVVRWGSDGTHWRYSDFDNRSLYLPYELLHGDGGFEATVTEAAADRISSDYKT